MPEYACYSCDESDPCILTFKSVCPIVPDQCMWKNRDFIKSPDWIRRNFRDNQPVNTPVPVPQYERGDLP